MTEDVWPVRQDELNLDSFNGIGFGMKGFTRVDESGRCFATRWFMLVEMPVVPRQRFYLSEGGVTYELARTATRYVLHGQSRLRVGEVLRTYAFFWLVGPVIVGVPLLPLLAYANQDSFSLWVLVGGLVGCLLAGSAVLVALNSVYRKRWAPLRTVRWLAARPD